MSYLFCLGNLQRYMRCEFDKLCKLQKRRKSSFVDLRKTKKSMRLPDKNKEQYEIYSQLVHNFKPFSIPSRKKPQVLLPQILDQGVTAVYDTTGTQSGSIVPKVKKRVSFQENKNVINCSDNNASSNKLNNQWLQSYDRADVNPLKAEDRLCGVNKDTLIKTTVGIINPPCKSSGQTINCENTTDPVYKAWLVNESKFLSDDSGEKGFSPYEDANKVKQLPLDAIEKPIENSPSVLTASKQQNKILDKTRCFKVTLLDRDKKPKYSLLNCADKGFSLYEDADQETMPRDVLEDPNKNSLVVNALVMTDLKEKNKPTANKLTEIREITTSGCGKKNVSLYEEIDQIESLPKDLLEKMTKVGSSMKESIEKPKQCSLSNTSEEQFSLYEDADQIECLPRDVLEEKPKQSFDLVSLNALAQEIRKRSATEYYKSCIVRYQLAKRHTCLPPLGPPPIMYPPPARVPPLPSCPKRQKKKEKPKCKK